MWKEAYNQIKKLPKSEVREFQRQMQTELGLGYVQCTRIISGKSDISFENGLKLIELFKKFGVKLK